MKGSTVLLVESPSLAHWRPAPAGDSSNRNPRYFGAGNSPEVSEGEIADLFIDAGVTAPTPAAPVVAATVEPTAVAAASPPLPTANGCPDVIIEVFGPNAPAACAVAWCESRWQPDATGAAGERGLFQVHPYWHYDSTYDPLGNTLAAYRISSGGVDWSAWTCKPW